MGMKVAELETLFTANVKPFDEATVKVETRRKDLAKTPTTVKVEGDVKGALAGMDRVESEGKRLTAKDVVARIDANISAAEKKADKIRGDLSVLDAMDTSPEVDADIAKARSALDKVEAQVKSLQGTRAKLEVIADTSQAEKALGSVEADAAASGSKAGADAGKGLSGGIIAAIATIPVAGAIVGIGAAIGGALLDGLQVEVRSDRLMATTGLDPITVGRLARASGEAYASNWGESLAANMDTARVAIQQGLLDPKGTARASEEIIASLSGVADMMGQDIPRVSQAAATIIRSGLAKDAAGAFDIIVKGMQVGNDKAEDWLDTLIEYPVVLQKLGITGAEMTGLINQGLEAGARNSDVMADALKEFQIRATDASTTSTAAYEAIGLSAEEMTAKIAAGGEGAREGLDIVLDRLREMEDPVARNAAAVGLFGTKAEDLGDALFAMDLSNAVDQLGAVEGAAARALGVLSDNAAGDIASAQRNIEVAADGIKGALAAAFNPQIEDFATFVSSNREQIMQFLLDLANGGLDLARNWVEFSATSTEAIGQFISGPMADLADGIANILDGMSFAGLGIPGAQGAAGDLRGFVDSMRGVKDTTDAVAENMRTNLIENGIDPAQKKLNEVAIPLIAEAALHDATVRLASDIDGLGTAADQSAIDIATLDLANLTSTDSGRLLADQLTAVKDGMVEQALKAQEAGTSQEEMAAQYDTSRQALMDQLTAMGLTEDQAADLVTKYGEIPDDVTTLINVNTTEAERRLALFKQLLAMPDIVITADMRTQGGYYANRALGSIDSRGPVLMAAGGIPGTALGPVATMVPPGTPRIVGDRLDVDEAFIPLDGSARSMAILLEAMRRMGVAPMADGGLLAPGTTARVVGERGDITIVVQGVSDQWGTALAVADVLDNVGV